MSANNHEINVIVSVHPLGLLTWVYLDGAAHLESSINNQEEVALQSVSQESSAEAEPGVERPTRDLSEMNTGQLPP